MVPQLRSRVLWRSTPETPTGKPEIRNLRLSFIDHDVRWFQVLMEQAAVVDRCQTIADLEPQLNRSIRRQPARLAQKPREIPAIDELHRDDFIALGFMNVVDSADMGMRDLLGFASFLQEQLAPALVLLWRRFRTGQAHLQCDLLPELVIAGLEYGTHPT
jgi:hypothetical protein